MYSQATEATLFNIELLSLQNIFSNSGMGLWYPEIQNRLGNSPDDNKMTICQVIDAFIEQQQQNETIKVEKKHTIPL